MSTDTLNKDFAIEGILSFRTSPECAIIADIDNDFATASVSISGKVVRGQPLSEIQKETMH